MSKHLLISNSLYSYFHKLINIRYNKEISFTFVLPSNNKYFSLNAPNITGMGVDKFIEKVASL